MRIISYNVNGIRAAIKKGFIDWLKTDPADVICLQEVKAHRVILILPGLKRWVFILTGFVHRKKDTAG
jgi:exonuclease III